MTCLHFQPQHCEPLFTQTFSLIRCRPPMFTTPKGNSVSHTRFTQRRVTLAPPSRGVQEPRGCCDVAPAMVRCGPLQRRPPCLGSERTHRRAALRRKAVRRWYQIVTEVEGTLELYNVRKTIRQSRDWDHHLCAARLTTRG